MNANWKAHGDSVFAYGNTTRELVATTSNPDSVRKALLIAAAPDLLEAAIKVYAELNARIDAAPDTAKPVFDGLAELHTAIAKATSDL